MTIVLNIPGLGGSGPTHWQSHWETLYPECRRVEQCNWNIPDKTEWLNALDAAVRACNEPPTLVAHSMGCALVAHWASRHKFTPIAAAIMVAPADVDDRDTLPAEIISFGPMPLGMLPFPTLVVASSNDHYVQLNRAKLFAAAWGADFVNIGAAGHINADSHLDTWDFGWNLVQELQDAVENEKTALQA
jgi:hypothetical protein